MRASTAFGASFEVSRETLERLATYVSLVEKWTKRINLVSPGTLPDIWTRHILDSAQVLPLAPEKAQTWCDLGSGAGFPGLVVAILAREQRPELKMTLIESDARKATFLRTVARETETEVNVIVDRIESADSQMADVVSARALAPLNTLIPLAYRHMSAGGTHLFPKGARYGDELREALEFWKFDCETHASKTESGAVILKLSELSRVQSD